MYIDAGYTSKRKLNLQTLPTVQYQELIDLYLNAGIPAEEVAKVVDEELRSLTLIICNFDTNYINEKGLPNNPFHWNKLEKQIAKRLQLENHRFVELPGETIPQLEINGQTNPSQKIIPSNRGKIEEVFDTEDPAVGYLIERLTDVCKNYGISTDKLTWLERKVSSREARKAILYTCFSIARELVVLIGLHNYDKIRQRIKYCYFHYFTASDLINNSPIELGDRIMEVNKNGYWNALPRVWVDELLLLAKNPDMVNYIANLPEEKIRQTRSGEYEKTGSSVREYFEKKSPKILIGEKKLLKISRSDYILPRLLGSKEIDAKTIKTLAEPFRKIFQPRKEFNEDFNTESFGRFQYKTRYSKDTKNEVKTIILAVFNNTSNLIVFRSALIKFCSLITQLDIAYSQGEKRTKSSIKTDRMSKNNLESSLASAAAAVADFFKWSSKFNAKFFETETNYIRIEPADSEMNVIRCRIFTKNKGNVCGSSYCITGDKKIIEYFEADPKLLPYKEKVEKIINDTYQEIERKKINMYFDNPDVAFMYYAMIRYVFRILKEVFPEMLYESEDCDEQNPNEVIQETRDDLAEKDVLN